jgi:hypothetical protein
MVFVDLDQHSPFGIRDYLPQQFLDIDLALARRKRVWNTTTTAGLIRHLKFGPIFR